MPTPKKGPRFGGSPAHHDKIVRNLTTELLRHGRIRTTLARAKHVQPLADRMVTLGKRGDLHARRRAHRVITDEDVLHRLFAEVGPANSDRPGGYTRVLKLGPRKGDGAPMALIELVAGGSPEEDAAPAEGGGRRRWSLRRSQEAAGAGTATAGTATATRPDEAAAEEAQASDADSDVPEAEAAAAEAEEDTSAAEVEEDTATAGADEADEDDSKG